MTFVTLAALSILAAVAAVGCFDAMPDDVAGGGGVETTEGNLAMADALTGPAGARVSLIPADFDPLRNTLPDSLTVIADAKGVYRFRGLAAGRYNLEAYLPATGMRCFRPGLVIAKGDRNIAGTDTLAAPGRLRLSWDGFRRGVLTQKGRRFRLELTGLEPDSGVTLDSLPAGLLPPFSFTNAVDSTRSAWTDSVRIVPGQADSLPIREAWAHSAILTWDTSSTLTPDSLDGYPLLVRLASPDFPFSEAAPGGADLRFTTLAGDPLPYAVEAWDSAGGHAEIWVRLKSQPLPEFGALRMDWGNPAAAYRPGPVFASVAGHASVWHLDEKTAGGFLEDAGNFPLRASAVGLVPEPQGEIGGAQRFDGIGAYASAADADPSPTQARLCVSAWIAPDTLGMLGRTPAETLTIVSDWEESDSTGFIMAYVPDTHSLFVTLGLGGKVLRMDPLLLEDSGIQWHLVGATYDGIEAAVYLDGRQASSLPAEPGDLPLPSREYLIGARKTSDPAAAMANFFRGAIDEVRVFRSVPRRAWQSTDYRTQQPGSKPLRFQKQR